MEDKHTPGYYRYCFKVMSDEKDDSLGATMTLRELLDCWWNCVHTDKGSCWKDAYYNKDGSMYTLNGSLTEKDLDKEVEVADEWDEDGDGYPIVSCKFVESKTIEENTKFCRTLGIIQQNKDNKSLFYYCNVELTEEQEKVINALFAEGICDGSVAGSPKDIANQVEEDLTYLENEAK